MSDKTIEDILFITAQLVIAIERIKEISENKAKDANSEYVSDIAKGIAVMEEQIETYLNTTLGENITSDNTIYRKEWSK